MPKVFLDYTQAELDQAYDQLVWAPQRDAIQAEIRKDCEAVRKAMPPRSERYGKSEMQLLDVFAVTGAAPAPVLVYLHGGAWLRGSRLDVAYPAPALAKRSALKRHENVDCGNCVPTVITGVETVPVSFVSLNWAAVESQSSIKYSVVVVLSSVIAGAMVNPHPRMPLKGETQFVTGSSNNEKLLRVPAYAAALSKTKICGPQ